MSESLSSGVHRYAGDAAQLQLRLLFTNQRSLAARPKGSRFAKQRQTLRCERETSDSSSSAPATEARKQHQKEEESPLAYYSGYLIKKRAHRWTIEPEEGGGCSVVNECGLNVRVVSELVSRICPSCEGCIGGPLAGGAAGSALMEDNRHHLIKPCPRPQAAENGNRNLVDHTGLTIGTHEIGLAWWPLASSGATQAQEQEPAQAQAQAQAALAGAITLKNTRQDTSSTRSERASNWKDTATVTSDNNYWQRTLARKLPHETRNHLHDYHYHCSRSSSNKTTTTTNLRRTQLANVVVHSTHQGDRNLIQAESCAKSAVRRLCSSCHSSCCLLNGRSKDSVGEIAAGPARRCCEAYEQSNFHLANGKLVSDLANGSSLSSVGGVGGGGESALEEDSGGDTVARGARGDDFTRRQISATGDNLCSQVVADNNFDSQVFGAMERPRTVSGGKSGFVRAESTGFPKEMMSNSGSTSELRDERAAPPYEVVYVLLEKHLGLQNSGQTTVANALDASSSSARMMTPEASEPEKGATNDESDSKVQMHHSLKAQSGGVSDDAAASVVVGRRSEQEEQLELAGKETTTASMSGASSFGSSAAPTDAATGGCGQQQETAGVAPASGTGAAAESSKRRGAKSAQIKNQTSGREWNKSLDETNSNQAGQQSLRLGATLRHSTDSPSYCLAVIVIDALNRLIQLKPDLNKLIALDTSLQAKEPLARAPPAPGGGQNSPLAERKHHYGPLIYLLDLVERRDIGDLKRDLDLLIRGQLEWAKLSGQAREGSHLGRPLVGQLAAARGLAPQTLSGSQKPISVSDRVKSIKLQVDFHFATHFEPNCRNLCVKYKLLANHKKGSKWKLIRAEPSCWIPMGESEKVGMKEEPPADYIGRRVTGTRREGSFETKLAQVTHANDEHLSQRPEQLQLVSRQQLQEGETQSAPVEVDRDKASSHETKSTGVNNSGQAASSSAVCGRRQADVEGEELRTCLLEGSTVSSHRADERGRFHFSCVEELVLEWVPTRGARARSPASSRGKKAGGLQDESKPLGGGLQGDEQLATAATSSLRPRSSASDCGNEDDNADIAPELVAEPEASARVVSNSAAGAGARKAQNEHQDDKCDDSSTSGTLTLVLEFYSSDFYQDKLQGWAHLSVPVSSAGAECEPRAPDRSQCKWNADHIGKCRCCRANKTRYELPIIRPELSSLVDKLRYYLIGQLPKSTPSLEEFARSDIRYMLQTKQSGKLVLDCEITHQFSYPNFDGNTLKGFRGSFSRSPFNHNGEKQEAFLVQGHEEAFVCAADGAGRGKSFMDLDVQDVIMAYQRARARMEKLRPIKPQILTG